MGRPTSGLGVIGGVCLTEQPDWECCAVWTRLVSDPERRLLVTRTQSGGLTIRSMQLSASTRTYKQPRRRQGPSMSHHFDSPTAIQDGRLNLCDVFAFPGQPGRTALILTVDPDAGRSSLTSFRPEAVYEFVAGAEHDDRQSLCLRVLFDDPAGDGSQALRVLKATGHHAVDRGTEIGRGKTGEVGRLDVGGASGSVWAGLATDPFWADGVALAGFLGAVAEGRYKPEIFDGHANIFDGRNVSAVVLEIPDDVLGNRALSIWARITLHGHAPQRRVSRMGQPMLRPLFFNVPGEETEELNRGTRPPTRSSTAPRSYRSRRRSGPAGPGHAPRILGGVGPVVTRCEADPLFDSCGSRVSVLGGAQQRDHAGPAR